jgi:hypothetical protein
MFSIGSNQTATGIVAFITGFSLLCGFCWAIPMCDKPKNEFDDLK